MAENTSPLTTAGSGPIDHRLPPVDLPDVHSLSEPQVRGRACVWCAVTLATPIAVDLGVQEPDAGRHIRWYPRACRDCIGYRLYLAQLTHVQTCEQCADDPARCSQGTVLRRWLREARRRLREDQR
ncbi:hypothetical protein ACFWPU_44935 [Streptomyces sp. NPDC058471]|uniref:hypothetical protein n=1 Tax=Streptomyces sp. NPDC058471 TaxID=3346516 RepID=UPI00365B6BBA